MSRINTNVSSLIAQRNLSKNNTDLNKSLTRLSTGLKINTGADDPAGLIASQALKAEKTGISAAISNASRASNVVGTAEGGLSEVNSLLTELQSLVTQSANSGGLSDDEISANQLQVDSVLSTINRVANSTSFEGKKLLNGSLAYTTSGVTSTKLQDVKINGASVPSGGHLNVVVQVTASAQTGHITHASATLSAAATIEISGNNGTTQVSFASGTTTSGQITAINSLTSQTGVSATVSGSNLVLSSTGFGNDQYVSVKSVAGTYAVSAAKDTGADAKVTVNGAAAQASGKEISFNNGTLNINFTVGKTFNTAGSTTFSVTGGGAAFQLASTVSGSSQVSLGIDSVSTASLGSSINGYLSQLGSGGANDLSSSKLDGAQKILTKAINQVSTLRGRLGAFEKYTVDSTVNSLSTAYENVSASESSIEDTDFSQETANLTRQEILSSASTTILSQANSRPQQALSLLQSL